MPKLAQSALHIIPLADLLHRSPAQLRGDHDDDDDEEEEEEEEEEEKEEEEEEVDGAKATPSFAVL